MSITEEMASKELMDKLLYDAKQLTGGLYSFDENKNSPDFRFDSLLEDVHYVQYPMLIKLLDGMLVNLNMANEFVKSHRSIGNAHIKELLMEGRERTAQDDLDILNYIQKNLIGFPIMFVPKSFIEKYELNKNVLGNKKAELEVAYEKYQREMQEYPTSVKNCILKELIQKAMNEEVGDVKKYSQAMLDIQNNRADVSWLYKIHETGLSGKSIHKNYETFIKSGGSVSDYCQSTYGVAIPSDSDEKFRFFVYYLSYIGANSDRNTKNPKIRTRLKKEQAYVIIVNLIDIKHNKFDIVRTDFFTPENMEKYGNLYEAMLQPSENYEENYLILNPQHPNYRKLKVMAGEIYMDDILSFIDYLYNNKRRK